MLSRDRGPISRVVPLLLVCLSGWLAGCGSTAAPVSVPEATFSATSLTFPAVTVGNNAAASALTLSNTGGQPLSIGGMALSDTTDYAVSATCGTSLAVGANCQIYVQFQPKSAASLPATLTLTDNSGGASGAQQVISLTGTGSPVPVAQAVLSPTSLSFPSVVLKTTSAAQAVTLSNPGTAPLEISGAVLSDTADFSITSTTCGSTLAAGGECTFSVAFAPQTVGPVTAALTVTDNAGGGSTVQQNVSLSGTGLPVPLPLAALSPTSLSFPGTVLGTTAPAQVVTLSNPGTAPLALGGVSLGDTADYSVSSACGATLAAGASCPLTVTFHPQTAGPLPSMLTLADNSGLQAGVAQQVVPLSGSGLPVPVAQASLSPTTAAFGSVTLGSVSAAATITLSNTGNAPLTLSGITLSDTQDFSLTSGCGTTLAAGGSCGLTVVFQPGKAGAVNATLTLVDNSGGVAGAQQTAALSGTGVALPAPQAILTPASVSFPDTMLTQTSAAQTVMLTNGGNAPLLLGAITLSDVQNFSLHSNCAGTLAAGASCMLAITFQPQSVAAFGAVLTVADNSGSSSGATAATVQQTVAVAGNSIAFALPRAVLSPSALTFPQTLSNQTSAAQAVTLTNTGVTALTVAGVTLNGSNASAFAITGGTCAGTVPAGASCTEIVVYSPKVGSAGDSANLVFTDDALGISGTTQAAVLSGTALAEVDSVENFGDSITCGYYAQPNDGTGLVWSLEGYAGLFDTWLGVPVQNWCRRGDTAADLSRVWVPFHSTPTSTDHQLFTLMIGTNDAYRYGIPQDALSTYTATVSAALAWLAMPNSDKVLANAVTQQGGTWTQDVGFGLMSTDPAASLTFNVNQAVAGRNLYVVYHVWAQPYGVAGQASIAVDGTVQATVDESSNSLVRLPTENGTTDTFLVATVPLGAAGQHTVTFSSVGPSGSSVGLLWAGVPQGDYHQVDGAPRVLVGLVTNSPSGNQTFAADNYNLQLKTLIPALNNDGMNVVMVPTDRVLDPGSDFADILHPDTAGHAKLAAAFEQYR